jgi:hypothetical protein
MVDFQIPSIIVSPIVEIFPYTENLDKEIERKSLPEFEEEQKPKGRVFSAPGSDFEDEDVEEVEEDDSELEDDYTDE